MNNTPATRPASLSDALLQLNTVHVLCDVSVLFSVNETNTDPEAVNKLSTMLQLMQEHIESLEKIMEAVANRYPPHSAGERHNPLPGNR